MRRSIAGILDSFSPPAVRYDGGMGEYAALTVLVVVLGADLTLGLCVGTYYRHRPHCHRRTPASAAFGVSLFLHVALGLLAVGLLASSHGLFPVLYVTVVSGAIGPGAAALATLPAFLLFRPASDDFDC